MNKLTGILMLLLWLNSIVYSQDEFDEESFIKQMSWGMDYKITLQLKNDSVYVYDIKSLHHSDASFGIASDRFTYYPVTMSDDFIKKLKLRGVELGIDTSTNKDTLAMLQPSDKTLWSSIHNTIGGGWIHFVNTLLYAIEKNNLNIHSAMMKRPESKWKPKPMTESYRRTRKWKYYVPVTMKEAKKEYKIRKERNELGDIKYIPEKFTELFLNTSEAEYKRMLKRGDRRTIARIELVKLLLGSNYLGKTQINFIKFQVLKSFMQYSSATLPSVIIFDNFNAAVALTLNEKGYHIEKIIYKDEDRVGQDDIDIRNRTIESLIRNINQINQEFFRDKLMKYYN